MKGTRGKKKEVEKKKNVSEVMNESVRKKNIISHFLL
jgi:hypothetical protein